MVRSHLTPVVIAGATGSGKSSFALKLAEEQNGEIICADSRQFYRFMRIGTAGPTNEEMARIVHHGFHEIDPKEMKVDAGYFVEYTRRKVEEIQAKGKKPIIVGGTGLYLRALRYGLSDVPKSDTNIVTQLETRCDEQGLAVLYQELLAVDPKSEASIKAHDRYRIIRALEIYQQTGQAPSAVRQSFSLEQPQFDAEWWLMPPKEEHAQKLYERVQFMFRDGLINEALILREYVGPRHWAIGVMGYHEALLCADKQLSLFSAIEQVFIRHRQYAKRQQKWFKKESFYRVID